MGMTHDAILCYRKTIAIRSKLFGAGRVGLAMNYHNLGVALAELGRYDEAKSALTRALKLFVKQEGKRGLNVALAYHSLGSLYDDMGRFADAQRFYLLALGIRKEVLGEKSIPTAVTITNLAVVYENLGLLLKAESEYEKALGIFDALGKGTGANALACMSNLVRIRVKAKKMDKAEKMVRQILAAGERQYGKGNVQLLGSTLLLAKIQWGRKHFAESEATLSQAMKLARNRGENSESRVRFAYFNLYLEWKKFSDAERVARRVLALAKEAHPLRPLHRSIGIAESNLALVLALRKQLAQSLEHMKHTLVIHESLKEQDPYSARDILCACMVLAAENGDKTLAKQLRRRLRSAVKKCPEAKIELKELEKLIRKQLGL
jgi:tetratricopeptide (TPR) repeat protein